MNPHVLRPDQLREFREIFDIFRDPKTDRIPIPSLLRVRLDLGFWEDSEEDLRRRVCSIVSPAASTNGLKFHDFLTFVATQEAPVHAAAAAATAAANVGDQRMTYEEEMEGVFRRLDLNGDGVLDVNEVFAADKRNSTYNIDAARAGRGDAGITPSNVKFEDSMEMEDAELVLDDAAKREQQKNNAPQQQKNNAPQQQMNSLGEQRMNSLGEKYADSWQQFERAEDKAAERKPGCYCLKCGGFKELMQE